MTDDPEGVNWISISDAPEGAKYITNTKRRIINEGVKKSRMVYPGDFLLTNSMSFGRPYILKTKGCIHDGWLVLSPLDNRVYRDFFFYLLSSDAVYAEFERLAAGATVKNLNIDLVKGIKIPLPPIPEQRRIAEVLDKAEGLKTEKKKLLGNLNALTDALFHEMFDTKSLQEHSIGDLLNSGALLLHKDGNHGSQYPRSDDFGVEGIPFLSAKSISDDGFIDNTQIEKLGEAKALSLRIGWIEKGDVLLSHNASVGRVALYDGRFERALIGTSLTSFRPNPATLDSHFLAAVLCTQYFQTQLKKNMGQATRNQVPITAQRELRIVIPTIKLQQEFAHRIAAVEKLKVAHRASLAQLDALFASLQHRAFRGEL